LEQQEENWKGLSRLATVRFWQPQDLPHLLQMAAETAWQITPPDDQARSHPALIRQAAQQNLANCLQSPGGTAVVAEENGRPVGYLVITLQPNERTGEPQGYLADIYVEPAHRRGGLAKELHRVGEAYLQQLGITTVTNWVHAGNEKGQKTGESFGLKPWGVMMAKRLRD
jgi:RimJ/RimL family protein N-acetyltransferase